MKTRQLGTEGLALSTPGFGCMGLGHGCGPAANEKDAIALSGRLLITWTKGVGECGVRQ